MTIKYLYSEERQINIKAFKNYVQDFVKGREGVSISHILIRNGIENIDDLRNADIVWLRSRRHIGPKRIETIVKMKESLSEN